MYQSFSPQIGILNKSIKHEVFYDYVHGLSKRTHFHSSLKYIYIYIFIHMFAHKFLNHVSHMTQDTCYKLNKFCNLVQFWYMIISMMGFIFFNCARNSTHLKIMVLVLRGSADGPCMSEDIIGWGLTIHQPQMGMNDVVIKLLKVEYINETSHPLDNVCTSKLIRPSKASFDRLVACFWFKYGCLLLFNIHWSTIVVNCCEGNCPP